MIIPDFLGNERDVRMSRSNYHTKTAERKKEHDEGRVNFRNSDPVRALVKALAGVLYH